MTFFVRWHFSSLILPSFWPDHLSYQAMRHRSFTALISPISNQTSQPLGTDTISRSLRLVLGNLAAWSHGSCVVYSSEMFDAAAVVDAVVDEKCSVLHGVPTHFLSILTEVEKREQAGKKLDFSSLRYHHSTIYPPPYLTRYLQNRYGGRLSSADRTDEKAHRQTQLG